MSKDFSPDDLKKAYRKAATKYHPDKVKGSEQDKAAGAEKFKEIGRCCTVCADRLALCYAVLCLKRNNCFVAVMTLQARSKWAK